MNDNRRERRAQARNGTTSIDRGRKRQSCMLGQPLLERHLFYGNLAEVTARVIEECLKKREIKVHSVRHRAKQPSSFGRKAATPSELDPNKPKYIEPIKEITDLAGVRVITHFPGTLAEVDKLLSEEFDVVERSNKGLEFIEEERFGYQSIHYLVHVKPQSEYERFSGAVVEVQVRTILQHAWAEIEHDIQYKSSKTIPSEIRRRFMALAGMLEIAEENFKRSKMPIGNWKLMQQQWYKLEL
jgi:putative GTP pyrophosphokinase